MRRSLSSRLAVGLVVALLGGVLAAQPAAADTVGQQEQEVKDVVAELDRMHQKVDEYNEDYLAALNDQAAVEAEIAQSQQRIADQQASLAVLQGQLANVAVQQFMGGGGGALGPLFDDPAQIDDGLQRQHLSTVAVDAGSASTDDYETLLSDLDKEQKKLFDQQQQALDLATKATNSKKKAEDAAAAQYRAEQAAAAAARAASASSNNNGGNNNGGNNSNGSGGSSSGSGGGGSSSNSGSSDGGSNSSGSSSSGSSDGGASNPPPVSSRAQVAVNAAASQMGVPYHFAQSSPGVGFDCSGLTAYAWGQAGVNIPHQSAAQYASTPHVPKDQAQPGDLIFYYSPISHVGIYVGGGTMIHAPNTGTVVTYSAVRWDKVVGVSRPG